MSATSANPSIKVYEISPGIIRVDGRDFCNAHCLQEDQSGRHMGAMILLYDDTNDNLRKESVRYLIGDVEQVKAFVDANQPTPTYPRNKVARLFDKNSTPSNVTHENMRRLRESLELLEQAVSENQFGDSVTSISFEDTFLEEIDPSAPPFEQAKRMPGAKAFEAIQKNPNAEDKARQKVLILTKHLWEIPRKTLNSADPEHVLRGPKHSLRETTEKFLELKTEHDRLFGANPDY